MKAYATIEVVTLLLLVGGTLWAVPSMTKPTIPFGVRVPAARTHDPVIDRSRRSYRTGVVLALALTVLAAVTIADTAVLALAPVALIVVAWAFYYRAHVAVGRVKRAEDWFAGYRQVVVTDTSLRTSPPPFPLVWAAPAVVITLGTAIAGVLAYPHLPARIPEHYGLSGTVDRWSHRSVGTVFQTVVGQVVITALIVGLTALSGRARPDLDAADPRGSAARHRTYLGRMQRALLVLAAATDLSLAGTSAIVWSGTTSAGAALLASFAPVLVATAALLAVALRTRAGAAGRPTAANGADRFDGTNGADGTDGADGADGADDVPGPGTAERDDDRFWRAGMIYVNRDDPSLLVPKRFGVGWTLNLGRPAAWIFLGAVVVIPLIATVGASLLGR